MSTSDRTFGAAAPRGQCGREASGRLTLAVLAAVVLTLAIAVPASANSHTQFRPGVVDGVLTSASELDQMGAMGVRSVRLNFIWHQVEKVRPPGRGCAGGVYDWRGDPSKGHLNYDAAVRRARANNVAVLPVLIGSPEYVRNRRSPDSSNAPHTSTQVHMHDWKCFVREAVGRYGRGGEIVPPGARPITDWQPWNEPNVRAFAARRTPDPKEYARFLKFTRPHILAEDPQATIVLAGMPEFLDKGMDLKPYLNRFYKVKNIKRQFDVLDLHSFAENYRGVRGALERLRAQLRQLGDRRRWVWITEVGWATAGAPRNHFLIKTEKGQATQLRRTFSMLRANRKRFKVGTVHWFRWRDASSPSERNAPFDYAGLYRKNGDPKRSCNAFASFLGGQCRALGPATTSTAASSGILDRGTADAIPSPPPE